MILSTFGHPYAVMNTFKIMYYSNHAASTMGCQNADILRFLGTLHTVGGAMGCTCIMTANNKHSQFWSSLPNSHNATSCDQDMI